MPGDTGVVWPWRTLRTWILRRIALGNGAEKGLSGVARCHTGH